MSRRLVSPWPGPVEFSADKVYRYRLERCEPVSEPRAGRGGTVTFVMLNPSVADNWRDDPTVHRCLGYAMAWGAGRLVVVNLFALVSTDPAALRTHRDPVGPENDEAIDRAVREADTVVCAWGVHGALRGRAADVLARIPRPMALGITKGGEPKHPLYLRGGLRPMPYVRRTP